MRIRLLFIFVTRWVSLSNLSSTYQKLLKINIFTQIIYLSYLILNKAVTGITPFIGIPLTFLVLYSII